MTNNNEFEYAGFWIRVWASIIDTLLIFAITMPIYFSMPIDVYLASLIDFLISDFLISDVLPAFAVILFWMYRQATPGKMAIHAKIVDSQTGEKTSTGQCVGRYFAYIPSSLIFGLGIFWIAFDKRKQGWHDKLAGTVVVRNPPGKISRFKNTGLLKNIGLLFVVALLAFSVVSVSLLGVNISWSAGINYVMSKAVGSVSLAIVVVLIPAGIYWLVKRQRMPGLNTVIWLLWSLLPVLILVGHLMYRPLHKSD